MNSSLATKVEEIWRDVLSVSDGQEDASFFELGGESISAVRLVSRVEDELGVQVDVGDIFEDDPNLASFVNTVVARAREDSAAA
ncbi:MAG TPA: phosphopantetheine-binding protein [Actinophytocola sp.]|uniref:phosphopantetheine-binding protein n=1 Tax=Actinophytocola sp. TaxID=1872138 RepID=UPI002DDCA7DD|nr:phosphopantetheine-binding protein [Actinophytocola sp.]HEV2780622.1 phosphopantetheine-binding protein [Actinophytocola sp.]